MARITNAAIIIGGHLYEGKDHIEAMNKAKNFGERMDLVDRDRDGLFRVSDGRIINRLQALNEFKISHSSQIPSQNENLKEKTVLFYDLGLMVELAIRMAKDFKEVKYFCPFNQGGFPKTDFALIGEGMGITRVQDFWNQVDSADLIVVPDTYCSDIVTFLRSKGKRVFGAGESERLELKRMEMRKIQKVIGLPTQRTEKIIGIDNLISYLKTHRKKWVKIDAYRGSMETFFHDTYDETEAQFLGELMVNTGAKGQTMQFVLEDDLPGCEPGYDGWVCDGVYPDLAMWGFECKGIGYLGKIERNDNLPSSLKEVNDKLARVFKKLEARTFFSSEIKVGPNKKGYLIDPCVRAPMPVPSAIHIEIWKNISEIIWNVAVGEIIKPIPIAKYGAGICFDSSWAKNHWTLVDFPKEMRQWVKLRMAFKTKEGKYYAVPGFESLGSVIGLGNTAQEAVNAVKDHIKDLKVKEVSYTISGLEEIITKVVPEARKFGVNFNL
jgi:hypothetical protein